MYSENLITPNPAKLLSEETSRPLLEAIDVPAVRQRLIEAERNGEYVERAIGEAFTISQYVNRALSYSSGFTVMNGLNSETMSTENSSDCFGYTTVLSECLDGAGISHLLAYSNGHAFAVVTDTQSYAWMIDALSPRLNDDMLNAVHRSDFGSLPSQLERTGRGAVRFSSSIYTMNLALKDSFEQLCRKNPWMKISGFDRDPRSNPRLLERDHTLVVTMYTPELGRVVFENIRNFEHFLVQGEYMQAYNSLMSLNGVFPEIDSRNGLPVVREYVRRLAASGFVALATESVEVVASSFGKDVTRDVRSALWKGDRLRDIGRITRDPSILDQAISCYREGTNPDHPLVLGKINKTNRIMQSIIGVEHGD